MGYWSQLEQRAGNFAALCYLQQINPKQLNLESSFASKVEAVIKRFQNLEESWVREISFERLERNVRIEATKDPSNTELISCQNAEIQALVCYEGVLKEFVRQLCDSSIELLFSGRKRRRHSSSENELILKIAETEFSLQMESSSRALQMMWNLLIPDGLANLSEWQPQVIANFSRSSPLFEYAFKIQTSHPELAESTLWLACSECNPSCLPDKFSAASLLAGHMVTLHLSAILDSGVLQKRGYFSELPVVLRHRNRALYGMLQVRAAEFKTHGQEVGAMENSQDSNQISVELNLGALKIHLEEFLRLRVGSVIECSIPSTLSGYIPLGDQERALVDISMGDGKLRLQVTEL